MVHHEKKFNAIIDISGVTLADLESSSKVNDIILLWGPDPQHYLISSNKRSSKRTHQDLDRKSELDSKAWTKLLKTHPEIIQRTIKYLEDRIPQISSGEKQELQEWKHILGKLTISEAKEGFRVRFRTFYPIATIFTVLTGFKG